MMMLLMMMMMSCVWNFKLRRLSNPYYALTHHTRLDFQYWKSEVLVERYCANFRCSIANNVSEQVVVVVVATTIATLEMDV